jgi:DinB superfamily
MDQLIERVRAVLETTPSRWETLTRALPEELLARQPAPGEWSALECLRHLLDTERGVFPARIHAFLAGEDFRAFNPDAEGTAAGGEAAPELAARFARQRAENLPLLESLTPSDFPRTARHSALGQVTLEQLLHEWAAHDLMHTVQGERALMQPFIAGSGAWRSYFVDHDVEAPRGRTS